MRIAYTVAFVSLLVTAGVGCERSSVDTPAEPRRAYTGEASLSRADGDGVGYLDQYCEGEGPAWVNVLPPRRAGQSFTPSSPSKHDCGCNFLVGVEVALTPASNRGPSDVVLSIINIPGDTLAMVVAEVQRGFDGWFRFDLPGDGIRITAGERLLIGLRDDRNAFGWRYSTAGCYTGGTKYGPGSCDLPEFGGNRCPEKGDDFFFRTYCDYPPEVYSLRELAAQTSALVTHAGIARSLRAKLDNASSALEDCDRELIVVRRALEAYIRELEALPPSAVDPDTADFLAQSARSVLGLIQTNERLSEPHDPIQQ
jgi:hypothetical protein